MYFYDTNVLLELKDKLFNSNEKFYISSITDKEIENIKTSDKKDEETKYNARIVAKLIASKEESYTMITYKNSYFDELREYDLENTPDNKIIACAFHLSKKEDIVFCTNDVACRNTARDVGLKAVLYKDINQVTEYTGFKEINFSDDELARFYCLTLNSNINEYNLLENEYLIIKLDNKVVGKYKWKNDKYVEIQYKKFESSTFGKIVPKNNDIYQHIAMDSLESNQLTVLRGPAGSGKAQPNSTLVPTKKGYIKLGDIKVGDSVLDRFGNETKVLAVYPQGLKENYKITFSDGRISYCNNEHIWSCYTSKGHLKNFTIQQMIDSGLQTEGGEWKYKIPISAPVEYGEKHFDIDPYVIGAFLGDGCCKELPLTFSSNDEEIVSEIAKLIGAVEYHKNSELNFNWEFYFKEKTGIKGVKVRFQTADFFKGYASNLIQLAQDKSIPEIYKFGSIKQRYSLIQGLMDTDGTIDNAQKGRTYFTSTSLKLIKDLQEICWSLGMSALISEDTRKEKYTNGICYCLTISCKKEEKPNLFRLKRKKDIAIAYANNGIRSNHSDKLTIKSIEKMPKPEEMTCILVDNEEHLYLTEQYIVTHNTYLAFGYMFSLLEKGKIDKIIIFCNTVATRGSAKLGFYPGSRTEKLLDSQIGNLLESKLGGRYIVEELIEKNKLVLLPLSDIRGYDTTGMNAAIYISEAQNLDIELMRLALQRIGEDNICILDGDAQAQVDLSMYAGENNGLRRVSQVFKGQDFYGQVDLQTIYRSKIANIANLM